MTELEQRILEHYENVGVLLDPDDPNTLTTLGFKMDSQGNLYKPDARTNQTGKCARCGRQGVWICGAGEYLCVSHQDDY